MYCCIPLYHVGSDVFVALRIASIPHEAISTLDDVIYVTSDNEDPTPSKKGKGKAGAAPMGMGKPPSPYQTTHRSPPLTSSTAGAARALAS